MARLRIMTYTNASRDQRIAAVILAMSAAIYFMSNVLYLRNVSFYPARHLMNLVATVLFVLPVIGILAKYKVDRWPYLIAVTASTLISLSFILDFEKTHRIAEQWTGLNSVGFDRVILDSLYDSGLCLLVISFLMLCVTAARRQVEMQHRERRLTESEERFRSLAALAPIGIFLTDSDNQCIYTNARLQAISGLSADALLGIGWHSIVHPDDREQVMNEIVRARNQGHDFASEFRITPPRGDDLYVDVRTSSMLDHDGTTIGKIGTVVDVTERRHNEKAINEANESLEARVAERTEDLTVANHRLRDEIDQRERTQQALEQSETLQTGLNDSLKRLAQGENLEHVLTRLIETIEATDDAMSCSILLLDESGKCLRHGAASRLPAAYCRAVDGIAVGPSAGCCGTAVYRGERVIVEDIMTDPLWSAFREPALQHRLRACWSEPILATSGRTLGTFAMYYSEPHTPGPDELRLIDAATDLAGLAIERKRIEEEQHEIRLALEHAMPGIARLDDQGRYVTVNDHYAHALGYEPAELVGGPWDSTVHQEDIHTALDAYQRMKLTGQGEFEARALHQDGTIFHKHVLMVKIMDDRGVFTGHHCFMRDITQRKQAEIALRESEARFNAFFSSSPIGMGIFDDQQRHVHVNNRLANMSGNEPAEHIGRTVGEVFPDAHLVETFERYQRDVLHGEGAPAIELSSEMMGDDDGPRVFLCSCFPIEDSEGRHAHTGVCVLETTDLKRAEEAAQQRQAELAHVTRLATMGEMAAELAHELNQPLTAITNYAAACMSQLGNGSDAAPTLGALLPKIEAQSRRAGDIIQRVRKLVLKQQPKHEAVDVNELIRDIAQLVGAEARRKDITVRLKLTDPIPKIDADLIQIEQVVLNLVRNGFDAMEKTDCGDRVLTIQSKSVGVDTVEVAVRDRGPGIQTDTAEAIFDPFVTTKSNGMGMGLSISKTIIEAHDGLLWAESGPRPGATFRFRLPVYSGAQPRGE
jgi:PAS domain S-box-containing protein